MSSKNPVNGSGRIPAGLSLPGPTRDVGASPRRASSFVSELRGEVSARVFQFITKHCDSHAWERAVLLRSVEAVDELAQTALTSRAEIHTWSLPNDHGADLLDPASPSDEGIGQVNGRAHAEARAARVHVHPSTKAAPATTLVGMQSAILLERVNNFRYVNKALERMNRHMQTGGMLIGSLESLAQRQVRIRNGHSRLVCILLLFYDYLVHRVWPKLPKLRVIYFYLTAGRGRVLSRIETFGRLYSCGFVVEEFIVVDGLVYFAARKVGEPCYDQAPTYGPIIDLHRIGANGKPIKVYKFRTMYPYSEYMQEYIYLQNGLESGGKLKDDPRVNALGKYLRRYFLDELPMIYNLIRGDLKLFGVRPISKHYLSLYPRSFQKYRSRFKPGLIPPFYVDMPKTLKEIVQSEKRYLRLYEKRPVATDLRYLARALYNIVIRRARGQ